MTRWTKDSKKDRWTSNSKKDRNQYPIQYLRRYLLQPRIREKMKLEATTGCQVPVRSRRVKARQRMTRRSAPTKRISKERDSDPCENSERIPNGISGLTALELPALVLVCLFQLLRSCVQTTRTLRARRKQKGVECFCIRRKVYRMHAVRWRRKVRDASVV